jgi:hypothetical protein
MLKKLQANVGVRHWTEKSLLLHKVKMYRQNDHIPRHDGIKQSALWIMIIMSIIIGGLLDDTVSSKY